MKYTLPTLPESKPARRSRSMIRYDYIERSQNARYIAERMGIEIDAKALEAVMTHDKTLSCSAMRADVYTWAADLAIKLKKKRCVRAATI